MATSTTGTVLVRLGTQVQAVLPPARARHPGQRQRELTSEPTLSDVVGSGQLATLKTYTSGRSLALKVQKQVGLDPSPNIVVLGRDGTLQLTDAAEAFLEKVDFADDGSGDARRLYPLGRSVPVVLDPDHGFGEPTLTTGARTESIAELVAAGEPRDRVAEVYDITTNDVDAAVRYENDRAA